MFCLPHGEHRDLDQIKLKKKKKQAQRSGLSLACVQSMLVDRILCTCM